MRSLRGTRLRKHRVRSSRATSGVPAIPNAGTYTYASPNRGAAALQERAAAQTMASNPASGRPHLAFVNSTSRGAIETLDRVALATSYTPTVAYPNSGFADALQTVAGAIVRGIGSRVFWVQTGGYDTHAGQGGGGGGAYANLMGTLGDGLGAFYSDVRNQGLAGDTTVIVFSEFGRRISENGSAGTDHGAAGLMMVLGGSVRGGLHGTRRIARARSSDAGEQLRRRALRDRLPIRIRETARPVAGCELGADSRR